MHARCPSCQTVFRLPPGALEAARGLVRCGCCNAVFDGRREGHSDVDDGADTTPPPAPAMMLDPDAVLAPRPEGPTRTEAPADPPAATGAAPPVPAPEEVLGLDRELRPRPARRHPATTLLLAFANVVLLGLAVLQLTLGLREPLLASAELRPWLERGCALVGCRLPALRDPERVEILARDVRAHPRYANALLVDLTIVNRAAYVQPFPVMQLTFTSLDEQWFAQRRFQPAEYLGPNRGTAERLPPDIPVQVVLELLDPGPEAVSYQFAFL